MQAVWIGNGSECPMECLVLLLECLLKDLSSPGHRDLRRFAQLDAALDFHRKCQCPSYRVDLSPVVSVNCYCRTVM